MADDPSARLEAYRAKRSADSTPEPFASGRSRPNLYVIQKHQARRLHYDFRLEWGGVLRSWAVPKGPSTLPSEKRLAMEVEDHPVEYADFEGIIPEGNYGAGPVIVWDYGLWLPLEDPVRGFEKGHLAFEVRGYKLSGEWMLLRTKRNPKEWLLIKKADAWAGAEAGRRLTPESVFSGLTLEELRSGGGRRERLQAELTRLGAPRRRVEAGDVKLMLAEVAERAFSEPGWLYELKYDGYRLLATREGNRAQLLYRRGFDATLVFPEVARAVTLLPSSRFVLDGELVVPDETGRPVFQRLQRRALLHNPADAARAAVETPAVLYAFDFLGFEDFDLRPLPLATRKELLKSFVPRTGPLRYADHIEGEGVAFYQAVEAKGLEGIMAKRADSPYRGGRSPKWLKLRAERRGDFAVVGWTDPEGSREGFGALHLGEWVDGRLVYAGRAGSGFGQDDLARIRADIEPDRRRDPPCTGPLPAGRGHRWVEPRLVCEVRYLERTEDGLLRQPVFLRLRDDKRVEECVREGAEPVRRDVAAQPDAAPAAMPAPAPDRARTADEHRVVKFTNLNKVFWPEEGYTKGDLIEYYRRASPWLLPYLAGRPVVLTRFPDGIHGKSFFQKDAPDYVPGWVRTERIWSESAEREIDYFICDDEPTLLYLINLGTIPLHVWSSRLATIQRPDWSIVDLDPKGAPFAHVVEVARAVHALCAEMDLPSFAKTSGSTGLHVLVPLGAQLTYEESRSLAELMSRVVVERLPDIATIARPIGERGGRVYLDFGQNGHGKLLVSPLSARPVPGAMVSTALRWSEVKKGLDPARFTIKTVPERLAGAESDPLLPVIDTSPDLGRALARLGELLRRSGS